MGVRLASLRWLPLSGLAFVACFALAVGLYGNGAGSDPPAVVAYYATTAHRLRQVGGFAALLTGCVFLIVYVVALVDDVVPDKPLSTVAVLSGGSATVLLATGNALWAATAFTAEIERNYRVTASAHLLIEDAGFAVVISSMAVAIPFVVVVSLVAWRSSQLPRWFALLGVVAAVALAAAYWYWPLAVFLVWIACGSVLIARPRHTVAISPPGETVNTATS